MAVGTVSDAKRRAYIGAPATGDADLDGVVDMLWDAAVTAVDAYAEDAPEAVSNLAALTLFAYLFSNRGGEFGGDDPYVRTGNALRKSGAMGLLRPYAVHRAGAV